MSEKPVRQVKVPDDSHPISISNVQQRIRIRVGEQWVANTANALSLKEASYPPVFYIPIQDVDASVIRPSGHSTYCPYKGECAYYDVETAGRLIERAIWYYPEPYAAVELIKDHVAFYADRVDEIREE